MPTITARYKQESATGCNANDRGAGHTPPSQAITAHAPQLAEWFKTLDKENGRSPYACAEAEALAALLGKVGPSDGLDFSAIEWSCPKDDVHGATVLWQLCGNCSQWLAPKGAGFGVSKTFQLSARALAKLGHKPAAQLAPTASDFAYDLRGNPI